MPFTLDEDRETAGTSQHGLWRLRWPPLENCLDSAQDSDGGSDERVRNSVLCIGCIVGIPLTGSVIDAVRRYAGPGRASWSSVSETEPSLARGYPSPLLPGAALPPHPKCYGYALLF